jgi:hypothetical protein
MISERIQRSSWGIKGSGGSSSKKGVGAICHSFSQNNMYFSSIILCIVSVPEM